MPPVSYTHLDVYKRQVYTDMGYFSNGLKNLYNGLKIAEQNNDRLNQSNLLYSISQVFLIQEEFDNSQYLLNQAQGFARNIQNTFLIPRIHKAMGDILAQEEKYSEATFEYQQALKRFSSYNAVSYTHLEDISVALAN